MDNGPELISHALGDWAISCHIELAYIEPGNPAQNEFVERFNRTFREAVLEAYLFSSIQEVRDIAEEWLEEYNTIRPYEAFVGLPLYQYAIKQA